MTVTTFIASLVSCLGKNKLLQYCVVGLKILMMKTSSVCHL